MHTLYEALAAMDSNLLHLGLQCECVCVELLLSSLRSPANGIGDKGVKAVCAVMKIHTTLTSLDLRSMYLLNCMSGCTGSWRDHCSVAQATGFPMRVRNRLSKHIVCVPDCALVILRIMRYLTVVALQ